MKSILIIGMGRFGHHLAQDFLDNGHDVMIMDQFKNWGLYQGGGSKKRRYCKL